MLIYIFIKPCLFIAHKKTKQQGRDRKTKKKNPKRADGAKEKGRRTKNPRRSADFFGKERLWLHRSLRREKSSGAKEGIQGVPSAASSIVECFRKTSSVTFRKGL
jgi:hypothetical protein